MLLYIKGAEVQKSIIAHFDALRAHPLLEDSTILYVFENNYALEHSHLKHGLQVMARDNNWCVLHEDVDNIIIGFRTSDKSKLRCDHHLKDRAYEGNIYFTENLINVNFDRSRDAKYCKDLLINQIKDMKQYDLISWKGPARRIVTSIYTEDNKRIKGKKDDLQRALSMLIDTAIRFRNETLPVNYSHIKTLKLKRKKPEHTQEYHAKKRKIVESTLINPILKTDLDKDDEWI
jgi:hypothetical protein